MLILPRVPALTISVLISLCDSPTKKSCMLPMSLAKNPTKTTIVPALTATPRNLGGESLERIDRAEPSIATSPTNAIGRPTMYWIKPIFQSYGWDVAAPAVSDSRFGTFLARENKLTKLRVQKSPRKTT